MVRCCGVRHRVGPACWVRGWDAVGAACVSLACDSPGAAGKRDIWYSLSFLAMDEITWK